MGVRGRNQQATRRRSGGSFLFGVIVGLILGLGIALGIAFYLNRTPIPFATKAKPSGAEPTAEVPKLPAIAGLPQGGAAGAGAQAGKAPEKPKFDFYRILPGGEEPLSEKELKERMRAAKPQPAPAAKEVYIVQAGSFQNPADADNQKARLAMLGFESSVEPANLPDKGTWYRVRLGPYTRLDELNQVRQALAQNGIDASLIKLKDASSAKAK